MCLRFVYRGNDRIAGFNFDIDLSVWKHKVIVEKDRFYIGILRPDGIYHSYHGVNQNGNAGTLLYVHGNPTEHIKTVGIIIEEKVDDRNVEIKRFLFLIGKA